VSQRRLSSDIFDVFSSRATVSVIGAVTGVILARTLGPHDRGLLALALLLPATLATVMKLGVTQANVYCVKREKAPVERVAANSLVLALVSGCGVGVIMWMGRQMLLSTVMREVPWWALLLALVGLPLSLIDNYFCGVLQAVDNFSLYNRRTVIGASAALVLISGAALLGRLNLFTTMVIGLMVSAGVITALVAATHRKVSFGLRTDRAILRRQLSFGIKSYVQVLAMHLLFRIDIYMVSYFLDPARTAFYSLALHFTELILEIPQAVGWVVYPRMASVPKEQLHQLTAQTCRRTILLTGLGGLGVIVFGPIIVPLWYGKAFAPAVRPLMLATLGMVAMSVFTIITRDFTSRNKQRINIQAGTLALLTNIGLNLFMIPHFGIAGAALTTSFSYTLAAVLLLISFRRESGIALRQVLIPEREDATLIWQALWQAIGRYGMRVPAAVIGAGRRKSGRAGNSLFRCE
jgi:O-antigen/teichoic acid export membrane protein